MNFADKLYQAISEKDNNPSIIGLDSDFSKIPKCLKNEYQKKYENKFQAAGECIIEFNRQIIESIKEIVPAVKIQIAFYEQFGVEGIKAFEKTIEMAKQAGLIVVEDGKRNDIGNTAKAYADGHLGKVKLFDEEKESINVDCLTVNPYLGSDSLKPFIDVCEKYNKGIFVLVKTSNPSSSELQNLESNGKKIYEIIAENVSTLGNKLIGDSNYSSIGAVVGATFPDEARKLRKIIPNTIFLVPGYGAQGGNADDIIPCFNPDGKGALIHSARGVIFAYMDNNELYPEGKDFAKAAREAAIKMKQEIKDSLKNKNM